MPSSLLPVLEEKQGNKENRKSEKSLLWAIFLAYIKKKLYLCTRFVIRGAPAENIPLELEQVMLLKKMKKTSILFVCAFAHVLYGHYRR